MGDATVLPFTFYDFLDHLNSHLPWTPLTADTFFLQQPSHSSCITHREMNLSILRDWLNSALNEEQGKEAMDTPKFIPEKSLCERDYVIIDMLNSAGHEVVSFTVSDPSLPDNPLIFVSRGFCELTGYTADEVVGKNCRFLQGKKTKEEDVKRIRDALKEEKDCSVNLLNHKKDGTTFINEV
jgi:PAS domain-containing protein